MSNPLRVMTREVSREMLSETLSRPWMRMYVFADGGPLSRTPEHYKKFFYSWKLERPQDPAHYEKVTHNWEIGERGTVVPVRDTFIPLVQPRELHQGLWGGECVIKGFQKRKKIRHQVPHYWVPRLQSTVVYSEILDKYMRMMVTERALNLIDDHFGLDNYILETSPADLMSELALKLKRDMYLALLNKSFYVDDPPKQEEVYDKYKQHIIPIEEADWYGLNLAEAYKKQRLIDRQSDKIGPYKEIFRMEYIEQLKDARESRESETTEETSGKLSQLLSKVNLFGKSGDKS